MERKLTTIVAADVVGYSTLIGVDEEGVIRTLRNRKKNVVEPLLEQHAGRLANTAGDSLLIEFPSSVEAVRFAETMQAEMARLNQAEKSGIVFRIGVNVGDVVVEGEDLLGGGVNIAARLEGLAPPGGIVLSQTAHDQIRDRLDLRLEDMGEVSVKNIARPIRAFRILAEGEAHSVKPAVKRAAGKPLIAGVAVLTILFASAAFWFISRPDLPPADPNRMAYELTDVPSIAVLAFHNLTGDATQNHVSDGLSDDIIAGLARLAGVVVVAQNSSFVYKDQPTPIPQIAEELSVQFILEGSVQQSDKTLRITARLVDAVSGHYVWTRKYDRPRSDFFAIRDEITNEIISELNANIVGGVSAASEFESMDNWYTARRSLWHALKWTPEDNKISSELAEEVLRAEPGSIWALARLAFNHASAVRLRWSDDPAASLQLAEEYALRAVELDRDSPSAHGSLSWVRITQNRVSDAITSGETALQLSPSGAILHGFLGLYLQKDMQAERAIEHFGRAVRSDIHAPGWLWENYGEALLMVGDHEGAVSIYLTGLENAQGFVASESWLGLAIAYDAVGDAEKAATAIENSVAKFPRMSVDFMEKFQRYKDQEYKERYLATLRRLGVPEH